MTKRDWVDHAACLGMDSDLFFPEGSVFTHIINRKVREAKAVCASCTVREECLADALRYRKSDDVGGVRAGLTKEERDEYRDEHKVKPTFKPGRVRGVTEHERLATGLPSLSDVL